MLVHGVNCSELDDTNYVMLTLWALYHHFICLGTLFLLL
jgi:hypothetical protein